MNIDNEKVRWIAKKCGVNNMSQIQSLYKRTHKYGMTLAELILTITVIGVVAAITIPPFYNNVTAFENKVAIKRDYTSLAQAIVMMSTDHIGTVGGLGQSVNYAAAYNAAVGSVDPTTGQRISNGNGQCDSQVAQLYTGQQDGDGNWTTYYQAVSACAICNGVLDQTCQENLPPGVNSAGSCGNCSDAGLGGNTNTNNQKTFRDTIAKYLKIKGSCDDGNGSCFPAQTLTADKSTDPSSDTGSGLLPAVLVGSSFGNLAYEDNLNTASLLLDNGAGVSFDYFDPTCNTDIGGGLKACGAMYIAIHGQNGQGVWGQDIYGAWILPKISTTMGI